MLKADQGKTWKKSQ